jgi:hypothetical protein
MRKDVALMSGPEKKIGAEAHRSGGRIEFLPKRGSDAKAVRLPSSRQARDDLVATPEQIMGCSNQTHCKLWGKHGVLHKRNMWWSDTRILELNCQPRVTTARYAISSPVNLDGQC